MLRVGLTGGIGAGKSAALSHLAGLGYPVVDADRLARQAVGPGTPGLAAVAGEFGPGVLAADGGLDRAALGRIVFADPSARSRLEAIIHPLVRVESARLAGRARAGGAGAVIFDIPLLVETGQAGDFDLVVVVSAPEAVRLARVMGRGLSLDQARSRLAAQALEADRLAAADLVLDGSGPVDQLRGEIDRRLVPLLGQIERPAR
ncbi:MAG: dephospho-CoA kinase [Bifidobacteriaceae bacterium]|nr:dephospho-CoA kinase [Bifidobacteriaceae bacterium]